MKIIGCSNYDLENVSDILIAENVNVYYGKKIIEFLQTDTSEHDMYYPKLVEDSYKLYKFEP